MALKNVQKSPGPDKIIDMRVFTVRFFTPGGK